jgi:hypothetical protein
MDIGGVVDQFGMNFTSVRLDGDGLTVYGKTELGFEQIDEIQTVVLRPGKEGEGDALFARMEGPQREWSATVAPPPLTGGPRKPYELGQEVYAVGLAIRGGEVRHVWRNLLPVISDVALSAETAPDATDSN